MAEKQMVGNEVAANRPTGPETRPQSTAEDMINRVPEPTDKGGKIYKVLYPTDRFVMEGMPVIESTGTRLTAEQAKHVLPVAEACGARIVEVQD